MRPFVIVPVIATLAALAGCTNGIQSYPATGAGAGAAYGAATPATYASDPERRAGVQASPANASLSDEQSFDAVASRETIESDAARRAAQAASYQVITPEALPQRTGQAGPNVVAYALQTTHSRGEPRYRRFLAREAKMRAACARYVSEDAAQRAFLAGGGPEKNVEGMDPDGDGFACNWDPAPFRVVSRAAQYGASSF